MTRQQLAQMDLNDLRSLRDAVKSELESRADNMRYTLNPGDRVKVNHNKTTGKTFVVVEIKRKKALLEDINDRRTRWNVSLGLIEKAK